MKKLDFKDRWRLIVAAISVFSVAGVYAATTCIKTAPSLPTAPTSLVATAISSTRIDLTWTDNSSDETKFELERCSGAACSNFAEIVEPATNAVSYSNTSLSASTSYSYRIRAVNAAGNSPYSNTDTESTPAAPSGDIVLGGSGYTMASHPRLNMDSTRLTTLRARSVAGKRLWDQLTINNNAYVAANCSTASMSDVVLYATSVGYLSDTSKTTWRDCAIAYFNKIKNLTTAYNVQDYGRMTLASWAYAYDFLHGVLSSQEKSDARDFVFNTWIPYIRGHSYDVFKGSGDCITDPTHNLCITSFWGQYLWGLACMGDDQRCDDLVTAGYNWYHQASVKDVIDASYVGCHSYSGSNYGRVRVQPYLLEVGDAEATALGMSASWMSWMDSCPQFYIHSTLPDFAKTGCSYTGNYCGYFDTDFYPGQSTWAQGRDTRGMLLPLDRDPANADHKKAQYWLESVRGTVTTPYAHQGRVLSTSTYGGKEYLAEWHLRYNQDATAVDYTGWATTYFATGLGRMFSRDAWGTGDKFWMEGDASSWYGDHQTTGCGGIKLFKNGEWGIVENDTRYAAGNSNQTALASYRRSSLFFGDGLVNYNGAGSYLTGGWGLYGQSSTCTFSRTSYGTTFAFYHANLDSALRSDYFPVSYIRRNVFHLKPITISGSTSAINYVVVLDAVDPTNSIAVAQQFYVPKTSPTVSDPDVSFTLTNTKTMIRRVYGTAISGNSITDSSGTASSQCIQCGSGMNRVLNTSNAASYHFIGAVLSMQGTSGALPTTGVFATADTSHNGVKIDDADVARIVLVPKDNTLTKSATFTYDVTWSASHSEHLVCGLVAGDKYDVSYSSPTMTWTKNNPAGAITIDSGGCGRYVQ